MDGDAGGFNRDGQAGAGELVGGDAAELLGGEDRGELVDGAVEGGGQSAEFGEGSGERLGFGCGDAVGVEGVGGEAEADVAGVGLFGLAEELGEAGVAAEEQGKDSGGQGVEGAEVADGFFAGRSADEGYYVVGG